MCGKAEVMRTDQILMMKLKFHKRCFNTFLIVLAVNLNTLLPSIWYLECSGLHFVSWFLQFIYGLFKFLVNVLCNSGVNDLCIPGVTIIRNVHI